MSLWRYLLTVDDDFPVTRIAIFASMASFSFSLDSRAVLQHTGAAVRPWPRTP